MRKGLDAESDPLDRQAESGTGATPGSASGPKLEFTGPEPDREVRDGLTRIIHGIRDERLGRKWRRVEVRIHAPIETATAVDRVHQVWNPDHVPDVESPAGLPRMATGVPCPAGSRLVEVSYISRPSGGMGSYHQFDGYFVSLVLAPDLAGISDARMEKAY